MRLLALDAALSQCSAALLEDDVCLGRQCGSDSRAAASALAGMVQALFAEHGSHVDAVGVTVGPGSFTGLRAAMAFAHGMAIGAAIPVVGVTVAEALLAAMAGPAWVALDARRAGRVFLVRDGVALAASLDQLPRPCGPVLVIGDAAELVADALCRAGCAAVAGGCRTVDPAMVGRIARQRLAGALPPCEPQPLYVHAPEARAPAPLRPAPL